MIEMAHKSGLCSMVGTLTITPLLLFTVTYFEVLNSVDESIQNCSNKDRSLEPEALRKRVSWDLSIKSDPLHPGNNPGIYCNVNQFCH